MGLIERLEVKRVSFVFLFLIIVSNLSCATTSPTKYTEGYRQKGIASWYGEDFHGRPTASGETYNMYDLTAAHRTLPLGSHVRVRNLENDSEVDVRINDRGPFVRGRIIDLSYAAAKEIGIVGSGTAKVRIDVLKNGKEAPYTVQVGAFIVKDNALRLKEVLKRNYSDVYIVTYETNRNTYYRVRVGSFSTEKRANKVADEILEITKVELEPFVTRRD